MFFEEIHSMTMSLQPIWQITCNSSNKNNTLHAVESLHIFIESNYKLDPWLKSLRKYAVHHLIERHQKI